MRSRSIFSLYGAAVRVTNSINSGITPRTNDLKTLDIEKSYKAARKLP